MGAFPFDPDQPTQRLPEILIQHQSPDDNITIDTGGGHNIKPTMTGLSYPTPTKSRIVYSL